MKEQIKQIISSNSTIRMEGLMALIDSPIGDRFLDAPASSKPSYHECSSGGLARHSITVYKNLKAQNNLQKAQYGDESILICGLFHDLGKSGNKTDPYYVPNVTKSGELHKSQPYKINKDFPGLPHEIRSLVLLSQFVGLLDYESQAIAYHAWLYGDVGTKEIRNWSVEKLSFMLHVADMYSVFDEKDGNNGNNG